MLHTRRATLSVSSLGLDLVHADEVVTPAGVEHVTGTRLAPSQRQAGNVALLVEMVRRKRLSLDLLNNLLRRQVNNDDAGVGTNNEPEKSLGEEDAVDGGFAVLLGEVSTAHHIPNHNVTVVGTGSKVRITNNHVKSGDLGLVSDEGVDQFHGGEGVPNLDGLIPRGRHAESGLGLVVEADAGNGLGVSVVLNGVSALGSSVPNLNLAISGTGHDHVVAGGDSNGEHVSGVTNELGESLGTLDVPEADGTIPGGGEAELAVSSQADLLNEVRVAYIRL